MNIAKIIIIMGTWDEQQGEEVLARPALAKARIQFIQVDITE